MIDSTRQTALKLATDAVAECIREMKSVPSGHLYAVLMSAMSLDTYNSIIAGLTRAGCITVQSHLITWIAK